MRPVEPLPQPEALAAEVGRRLEGFAGVHIAQEVLGALHVGAFCEQLLLLGLSVHVSASCARGLRLLHDTETFVGHAWFWA